MQEARKNAEAEKIHIMEELWQARFGHHGMGFCSWSLSLCIIFVNPILPWPNLFTGGCKAAPWASRPLQQGASGDQSFQILKTVMWLGMWPAVVRRVAICVKEAMFWTLWEITCWWPDACVHLTTLSYFPSHFNLGRPPSAPTAAMAAQGKHLEGPYRPSGDGEVLYQGPPGSWSANYSDFPNTALFQKPTASTVWGTNQHPTYKSNQCQPYLHHISCFFHILFASGGVRRSMCCHTLSKSGVTHVQIQTPNMCHDWTLSNDANEDMSDDPSVRKRLRRRGKTRWREERTTIESSRLEIESSRLEIESSRLESVKVTV